MAKDIVLYEVKDKIAYITLNNPDNRNRLDSYMCIALGEAWDKFAKDDSAWVALLSASGKNFYRGADLRHEGLLKHLGRAFPPNGTKILKPIVGAVRGMVAGSGFGLATYGTDITYATKGAQFVFAAVWVGIVGGIVEYVPYIPFKISLELLLSGQPISGERAYEVGLVNHVCKDKDELMTEATKMAKILSENAPLTIRVIKYGQCKHRVEVQKKAISVAKEEFEVFIKQYLRGEDLREGKTALFKKTENRGVRRQTSCV